LIFKLRKHQEGTALITVLSLSVLLFLVVSVSSTVINNSGKDTQENFRKRVQANNIARAGLSDAVGWFKKKSVSSGVVSANSLGLPCSDAAFSPVYDADPLLRETIDPTVGLVKDIALDSGRRIYGRYIVRKQPCDTNAGSPAGFNVVSSEPSYNRYAVHDVTEETGNGSRGDGVTWKLVSEGIVYRRNSFNTDADGVFTEPPLEENIIERAFASININRLSLRIPDAPVTVLEPEFGNVTQSSLSTSRCNLLGTGSTATVIYQASAGAPSSSGNCQMEQCPPPPSSGNGNRAALSSDPISVQDVFAVSQSELSALADYNYSNMNDLKSAHFDEINGRNQLPMSIYYLEGSYTFSVSNPLLGSGILFVDGNLTLQDSSFSFSGLVYVTGQITIQNDNTISGALMANRVNCNPSLKAEVERNQGVLENVRDNLALYRENSLSFVTKDR
jgi:hypothetical protein